MLADRYITAACLTDEMLLQLWRSLPPEKQSDIAIKALRPALAEIVWTDDGLLTTAAERDVAVKPAQEGCQDLQEAIEAAFPSIMWWYPDDVRYEARDRDGHVLGIVHEVSTKGRDCAAEWMYGFASSPDLPLGKVVEGTPADCLPARVRKAVADGGWFGVVLPDGRRYPDDLRPLNTDDGAECLPAPPRRRCPDRKVNLGQFSPAILGGSADEHAA